LLLRLGEVARLQRRLRRLFRDRHPFVLPPRLGVAAQKRLRLGALGGREVARLERLLDGVIRSREIAKTLVDPIVA
jgi:hypothetical protein